ncbi:hypothetical protein SEMRO_214_G088850.1 [Seminavis robusta]|uniref:Uncharacterized protein n=1 Tax=Seminavis robusta TaxID=568900 RepID=A0A9N8DQG9_9STRA|nr:hypothetical protein SEMRO_214_G088850.1 [Seminavis robusta]|eukprot:Sro214_g088850.1 n/a (537) ;mRNA; r:77039-79074
MSTRSGKGYSTGKKSTATKGTSARKVKDKVASPAPRKKLEATFDECTTGDTEGGGYSSDDWNFEDGEDCLGQSDRSASTAGSRRVKLSLNIQKSLLEDILLAGGIDKFDLKSQQALSELCIQRPELYGQRGDQVRKKIQKKVYKWKEVYKDSDARSNTRPSPSSVHVPNEVPSSGPTPDPVPSSVHVPNKVPSSVQKSWTAGIPPVVKEERQSKPNTGTSKMSEYPEGAKIIKVDAEHPENNGPFFIYPVPDMEAAEEGHESKGFFILYAMDERFSDHDETVKWISANVVGSKQIHIKVPSLPFLMAPGVENQEKRYDALNKAQVVPLCVMKSINAGVSFLAPRDDATISHLEAAKNEARKWETWVLDFSRVDYVGELKSSLVYAQAGPNECFITMLSIFVRVGAGFYGEDKYEEFLGFKVEADIEKAMFEAMAKTNPDEEDDEDDDVGKRTFDYDTNEYGFSPLAWAQISELLNVEVSRGDMTFDELLERMWSYAESMAASPQNLSQMTVEELLVWYVQAESVRADKLQRASASA